MRRLMNLLIWTMLVGGSLTAVRLAGQEPEDQFRLTVNGVPLPGASWRPPLHNPWNCRSCTTGRHAQWETP